MMFTFLYLTDWNYFVCKSVVAAKCIYNRLGRLVKVELWHTSCPAHLNTTYFTFLLLTQDYTGLFSPFVVFFFFRRCAITPKDGRAQKTNDHTVARPEMMG